jgi:hypothetical protein
MYINNTDYILPAYYCRIRDKMHHHHRNENKIPYKGGVIGTRNSTLSQMIWKVSQNIADFAGQRGKARVDSAILIKIDGCLCGCLGWGEGVCQGAA